MRLVPRRGASRLPVASACGNDPSQPLPLVGEHDGAAAGALEVRSSLDDRATRKGRPVLLKVVTRLLAVMGPFSPCGLSLTGTSSSGVARSEEVRYVNVIALGFGLQEEDDVNRDLEEGV